MAKNLVIRNGNGHGPSLTDKVVVGSIGIAAILTAFVAFFGGPSSSVLISSMVLAWSFALVNLLIVDQHNAWIASLGFFVGGVLLTLVGFADIPQMVELVVMFFIGAVLLALNTNRTFGTFDWIAYLIVVAAPSLFVLFLIIGATGGITAFLFDEGSSVGIMSIILAGIIAGTMVEIGKYHDPDSVDPEEAVLALRLFTVSAKNFVYFTNLLAFVLAIGHPVSLSISRYAGWDIPFWLMYVTPISILCYLVGLVVFFAIERKEVSEFDKFYRLFREYKLNKGFEVQLSHKIGLMYLTVLGILQFGHQYLSELMGQPHEVGLIMFPLLMSVVQGCHVYLIDKHKLHGVWNLPLEEFANMFGIFFMASMMSVAGILQWVARKITPLAMAYGVSSGIIVLGFVSGTLSAFLENLGVALAINVMVDSIFGGVLNTTPIRMSVMILAMLAGNTFIFASVAGLVGVPLLNVNTVAKLYTYADRQNKIHVYDPFLSKIRSGIPVVSWLRSSVIMVIVTCLVAVIYIVVWNNTFGYPEGVYYCEYANVEGCTEGSPGHGHGADNSSNHGLDEYICNGELHIFIEHESDAPENCSPEEDDGH